MNTVGFDGVGKRPFPYTCELCQHIVNERSLDYHGLGNCVAICQICQGSGEVEPSWSSGGTNKCPVCNGSGADYETLMPYGDDGDGLGCIKGVINAFWMTAVVAAMIIGCVFVIRYGDHKLFDREKFAGQIEQKVVINDRNNTPRIYKFKVRSSAETGLSALYFSVSKEQFDDTDEGDYFSCGEPKESPCTH